MNAQKIATDLLNNGYMPVPVEAGQKAIRIKGWESKPFTADDFTGDKSVGIRCGDGGLAFMDIDVYDAKIAAEIAAEWTRRFPSDQWLQRTGMEPKTGFLFRLPEPLKKIKVHIAKTGAEPGNKKSGLEMLGEGQQFVAFGIHPDTGKPYRWHGENPTGIFCAMDDLPVVTEEQVREFMTWATDTYGTDDSSKTLSERATAAKPAVGAPSPLLNDFDAPSVAEVEELLSHIDPDIEHDEWLRVLMGLHDLGDHMLQVAIDWSAKGSKFEPGDVETRWASFTRGSGVTWATVPAMARDGGADLGQITIQHRSAGTTLPAKGGAKAVNGASSLPQPADADGPDFPDIKYDKRGVPMGPLATRANLERLVDWAGLDVRFDVYNRRMVAGLNKKEFDINVDAIVLDLAARYELPKSAVTDQLDALAFDRSINKPLQWLEGLEKEGKPSGDPLAQWLYDCKMVSETDFPLDKIHLSWPYIIWSKFFIACCAAADQLRRSPNKEAIPKFEQVIVIVSKQGMNKSTAIRELLPPALQQYFGEGVNLNLSQKDSYIEATGYWIAELGELDATFRKSDIAALKAFLSKQRDEFRLPYARRAQSFPRRTVFFASVNVPEFLQDSTGNRRYLPIELEHPMVYSKELGEKIFSQAWHRYLNGDQWWLTADEDIMAKVKHREHDGNIYIPAIMENFNIESERRDFMVKPSELLEVFGLRGEALGRARHALKSALEHFDIYKAEGSYRERRYYAMPPATEGFLRRYKLITEGAPSSGRGMGEND